MAFALLSLISENFATTVFNTMVEDQNINRIVKALESTDTMLTIKATCSLPEAKIDINAPTIWKSGAPGGWPISSLAAVEMYSPQSQKLNDGSTVRV